MHGVGSSVRNAVHRAVMTVTTPEEFVKCADRLTKYIHRYFQPIKEPKYMNDAPYSTTLQILITRILLYQFFFLATDKETFYEQ